MKNKKGLIFILIILMSVGFAAVTTTLIINGTTIVAENEDDYQIYFSGAEVDKEDYTNEIISKDKKTITFETKNLMKENDTSELTYEVTNGSTQYDANVKINVIVEENDLIEVTNTYDDTKTLSAKETRTGALTVKLKKGATEVKDVEIKVELIFNAEEREEIDTTPITTKVYSISGYFVDKDGKAIANANIAVFSENPQFVTTDDYGYIYIGNLERGNHELYYIEKSDVNKTKEEIKKNAIDKTSITTSSTKTIIFDNGHEIKDRIIGEENKKTIKITLVKNNGEVDEEIEVVENTRYENLPTPNKVGTKFLYWKDETGKIITENTLVKSTTTNKLYAYYGENTYKIAYNLNGGTSSSTPTGAVYGKDIEITNPTKEVTVTIDANNQGATLTKTSYIGNPAFTGWTGTNLSNTALVNNVSWNGTLTKGTTFKNLTSELNGTVNLTANYDKATVTLDTPTKTGYTCGYTDTATESIKYTTSIAVSDDQTIYVKCNPNTYTINFDSDGGTTVNSKTATYDSKIGTLTSPTKTGYNFAGWYLDTESITSESVYKYAKDITLKAKWTEATNTKYTVNYYLQTLDKTYETVTESIVYTGTTNKTVDAELKTYEGFVTPSKQTVKILADGSAKVDYYYVRKELTVTFVNDSTKKEVTYLYGKENQAFTDNGFTKTGYTLTGYSNTNGGSKNYEVTSTVTGEFIDTNYPSKTVYAVFTANTYKIAFNNNGGTGTMDTITCTYDKDCTLTSNTFTKTGYTFAGWSKTSTGSIEYTNGATVKNLATSGSITLYAKWTANTYTITYNANGGSGTMSKTTCTYDTDCTLAANSFTKTGYTFANWTKDSTSGTSYTAGSTVKNLATSGNVNMYAKWNTNTYKIAYTMNNGTSGTNKPTSASYDANVLIDNPTKKLTVTINANSQGATISATSVNQAQIFNGWTVTGLNTSTAKTGTSSSTITTAYTGSSTKNTYFKNLTATNNGTVTFTANWTNTAVTLPTITKTGYTCGYATSASGSIAYESGSKYTPSGETSKTLYAKCNANTYTITYNANGGSGTMSKTTCTYDTNCTLAVNSFTYDGYNFAGWTKDSTTGTVYASGTTIWNWATSGNINMYADWGENLYNLIKNKADTTTATEGNIPVYYFRGAADKVNNNIIFNNMCWKIIRTTETGGIKIIYNGTPVNGKCETQTGTSTQIGTSGINVRYSDNTFIGYMYGTAGSDNYEATHANLYDSLIKKYIENWYSKNFDETTTSKLEDTVFCNDRSTKKYDRNTLYNSVMIAGAGDLGYGKEETLYAAAHRASEYSTNPNPSLVCQNNNDKFTVNSKNGNGKLTNPVGLITLDEVVLAGFNTKYSNEDDYEDTTNYLNTNKGYWTLSPVNKNPLEAYVGCVSFGNLSFSRLDKTLGVRPVVSLASGTLVNLDGEGTTTNPFVVK